MVLFPRRVSRESLADVFSTATFSTAACRQAQPACLATSRSHLVPLNAATTCTGAHPLAAQAWKACPWAPLGSSSSIQQFWQPQTPAASACGLAKSFQGMYRGKRGPAPQLHYACLIRGAGHPPSSRPCRPQAPAAPSFGMAKALNVFIARNAVLRRRRRAQSRLAVFQGHPPSCNSLFQQRQLQRRP